MKDIEILKKVCSDYGVSIFELLGKGRRAKIIEAKIKAIDLFRKENYSYPEIATILGNKKHSTIISLHKKYKNQDKKLSTG